MTAVDTLEWRAARLEDAAVIADLVNAEFAEIGSRERIGADRMADEMRSPGWVIATDSLVAVTGGGELVGMTAVVPPPPGGNHGQASGGVLPGWRGHGIGRRLLRWSLDRSRAQQADRGERWSLHVGTADNDAPRIALFERFSAEPIRYWFGMERAAGDPVCHTTLANGLRVQTFTPDLARELYDAHQAAFADHWGHQRRPFEQWRESTFENSSFRPELTFLAVDSAGAIGGYVLTVVDGADPDRATMGLVATRREWRGKGVASHLMATTLAAYRPAGFKTASLGVDSTNPTGAVAVYERMGFHQVDRWVTYSLPVGDAPTTRDTHQTAHRRRWRLIHK